MDLNEARKLLAGTIRHELRDHAFGDREIMWMHGDVQIAGGYFGDGNASVWIGDEDDRSEIFNGDDARSFLDVGILEVSRNDETGPDTYTEGEVMPGLSKGDVYHELTGEYLDEKEN